MFFQKSFSSPQYLVAKCLIWKNKGRVWGGGGGGAVLHLSVAIPPLFSSSVLKLVWDSKTFKSELCFPLNHAENQVSLCTHIYIHTHTHIYSYAHTHQVQMHAYAHIHGIYICMCIHTIYVWEYKANKITWQAENNNAVYILYIKYVYSNTRNQKGTHWYFIHWDISSLWILT